MLDDELYQQILPEVQTIFRSGIVLRTLHALHEKPGTLNQTAEEIGSISAALLPKMHMLERKGFVEEKDGEWKLTNSGNILRLKIIDLLRTADEINPVCCNPETPFRSFREIYDVEYAFLQSILRSGLLIRILFALTDDKKDRIELRSITATCSSTLTPKIRKLFEHGLIQEQGYYYSLTDSGQRICAKINEFLRLLNIVIKHNKFWNEHSIDQIPEEALLHLGDLENTVFHFDTPMSVEANYQLYLRIINKATFYYGISGWGSPGAGAAIGERVKEGFPSELVIDKEMVHQLLQPPYLKMMEELRPYPNLKFWVTDMPINFGITVTDQLVSLKLILLDGKTHDASRIIDWDGSQSAVDWGKRLFEHFRERSVPLAQYLKETSPERSRHPLNDSMKSAEKHL